LSLALPLLPVPARAQKAAVRYEEKKKQAHSIRRAVKRR